MSQGPRVGGIVVLLLTLAACEPGRDIPASVPYEQKPELTRFAFQGGATSPYYISAYCDTANGNLIYLASKGWDSTALAVVPGGCK